MDGSLDDLPYDRPLLELFENAWRCPSFKLLVSPSAITQVARERESESEKLVEEIEDLKPRVRLEALSVYQVMKVKPTAKGEKGTYTAKHAGP